MIRTLSEAELWAPVSALRSQSFLEIFGILITLKPKNFQKRISTQVGARLSTIIILFPCEQLRKKEKTEKNPRKSV